MFQNPFQGLIPQILRVISWLVEVDEVGSLFLPDHLYIILPLSVILLQAQLLSTFFSSRVLFISFPEILGLEVLLYTSILLIVCILSQWYIFHVLSLNWFFIRIVLHILSNFFNRSSMERLLVYNKFLISHISK